LIAALIISIFVGERIDAIVIGIILVLNALFGFYQEYRAERSIEALKKMSSLKATVIRSGKEKEINANLLVLGDLLILSEGNKIPADSRIFEEYNLQTQEASLTGESTPVKKEVKALAEKTPLADRINMVFSGTVISSGKGKAIVTGTGMGSEIGRIAKLIQETEDE
jgi:Ca2+-transporting ATPase